MPDLNRDRGPMPYSPLQSFIAPARDTCQIWRTFAGLAFTFAVYTVGLSTLLPLLFEASTTEQGPATSVAQRVATSPMTTLVILFSFGFLIVGTVASVSILHQRSAFSLLGDPFKAGKQFWNAIKAVLILNAALIFLPPYGESGGTEVVDNLAPQTWLLLLPLSLLGLIIQTSAEEIFFRGYLLQQLAARFSSPLIWMGGPAVLFALGHYNPSNETHALSIVLWAALFSLAASDLVARTGNLGAAIGLHFVNNAFAILIVSYPGEMGGLSLFILSERPGDFAPTSTQILVEYAMLIVSWLAIRLAVRR